jgi:PAS domain-containing protein
LIALWLTWRSYNEGMRARLAETALRESTMRSQGMENRLHLLAHAQQSANDCISITDTDNRILYANDAFLRTYEYDQDELVGQSVEVLRSFAA